VGVSRVNKIFNTDCLGSEGLCTIADKSIDMILCDLPYGVTANKWDIKLPLDKLWIEYKRILKPVSTVVLTATQPFTTDLIVSNRDWFKYELIWNKLHGNQLFMGKIKPISCHENILVFGKKVKYNPQMRKGTPYKDKRISIIKTDNFKKDIQRIQKENKGTRYPLTIYNCINANVKGQHSTQKPIKLFEYLIKTYSDKNDIILDNCIGSGTTAIAAIQTSRQFIGFEKEKEYYDITMKRIQDEYNKNILFDPEKASAWQQQTI